MELTDFLEAGWNACKLKGDWNFFCLGMVKMGVASLVSGLYFKNEQME